MAQRGWERTDRLHFTRSHGPHIEKAADSTIPDVTPQAAPLPNDREAGIVTDKRLRALFENEEQHSSFKNMLS